MKHGLSREFVDNLIAGDLRVGRTMAHAVTRHYRDESLRHDAEQTAELQGAVVGVRPYRAHIRTGACIGPEGGYPRLPFWKGVLLNWQARIERKLLDYSSGRRDRRHSRRHTSG